MTLSDISIRNPVFAWMLMIGLMFFGWIGFSRLGVSQMPDVDFPVVTVSVTLEGAAPEIMETEVIDVIEDAVMSIEGVRSVKSSARSGSASITIEFELNRNIDVALQEVQTRLSQAQRRLPTEIDPPTIIKINPEDQPIMWVGLSGKGKSVRELVDYADEHVKPFLQTISGVGDVFMGGFLDRNLRVWLNAQKMREREITAEDILDSLRTQHTEVPAGRIETREREFNLRLMGEAISVTDFGNILVTQRGGRPIYKPFPLKEIARIEDGVADVRRIARINGDPGIGLGIRKQRGANAVQVAQSLKQRLKELTSTLAPGFQLGINFDSTRFIEDSISELNFTLLLSALLTSLVCWLFLGSFQSTLNVLLSIPTSILGTFLVLYFMGFTLNTFTLLGLSLGIGIVVDDAIMVLENITRHGELGKSRILAALDGSKEITLAALAATLAIIAIFIPVAFMKGVIGKFFYQFGVTISVAVALSLLEALTLTPMRCSQFLNVGTRKSTFTKIGEMVFLKLNKIYRTILEKALHWKWAVLFVSIVLFSVSLALIKNLRKEFIPSQDQSMFIVQMQAPIGSSIEYTDNKFKIAEAFFQNRKEEVERYFASIGGFGGGEVDTGIVFVTLKKPHERNLTQSEFMDLVRHEFNQIPGIKKAVVQDLSTRGFTADRGFPVEFSIRGPDFDQLGELAQRISLEMVKIGLYQDVDNDYRVGMPEFRVFPDREKAALRGVSMASLGTTINTTIGGIRAGKYTHFGHRYDVRVRLEATDRVSSDDIKKLYVRNDRGEIIPLSEVVNIVEKPTLQSIQRRDRERSVGIFANLAKGVSQANALDQAKAIAEQILPQGYRVVFTGGSETFKESFQSLLFALWVGIIVAYMVLASQFNSFLHPFTILLALPFSITGGLLALYLGDHSINIFSLIGLLLLMGIVKKNSILLVDFTNQMRTQGRTVREALLEACPTRLRPILMTSVSTVAAAIPPALALGPGAETRIPMAVSVIGGVIVSTLLTLFVIPCAYEIFSPLDRSHRKPTTILHDKNQKL